MDALAAGMTELLDGTIAEPCEITFLEPDFVFMLYPQKDLRNDPAYTYVAPGHEIQDIYAEWRIFFWNDGLTENFLSINLARDDITALQDCLIQCR